MKVKEDPESAQLKQNLGMGRNNKLSSQFTTTKRGRTQNIFFTFAIEVLKSQKCQPSALLGLGMRGAYNRLPSKWASISARGGRS